MTNTTLRHPDPQLRAALRVNALVSGASGVFAAVAGEWLGDVMGVNGTVTRVVGVALVLFAVDVALSARAERDRLIVFARAIGVADVAWVAATTVVLAMGVLTTTGAALATLVGVVVAAFAALELRGATALATRQRTLVGAA